MSEAGKVLVIDDEEIMREILESVLRSAGYVVKLAASGEEGLAIVAREPIDLAIVDVMLPDCSGIDLLPDLKKLDSELVTIMITAFASVETAIEAMKRGAFDYVTKPFKNDEVCIVVANGIKQRRLVDENRNLKAALVDKHRFDVLVGKAPSMQKIYSLIRQVAPSKSTVLITGESGTGKELVAQSIHNHSDRKSKPFLTVNSGSLPPDLLESNLFGHVKGAFTGAVSPKKGLFEIADGGSIFLDEIGTVPLETQSKLLRVIQEKEFMRLGGIDTISVDVRIIAATNSEIEKLVEEGSFREDLYYRLNVINISLPPLRQRREDIALLAQHFLDKYNRENSLNNVRMSHEAVESLLDYNWPGNVRELENVNERAVVLADGPVIDRHLAPKHSRHLTSMHGSQVSFSGGGISFRDVVADFEKSLIESSLENSGGVQRKAAQLLGLKPTTLNEMIKRYNIDCERKQSSS